MQTSDRSNYAAGLCSLGGQCEGIACVAAPGSSTGVGSDLTASLKR